MSSAAAASLALLPSIAKPQLPTCGAARSFPRNAWRPRASMSVAVGSRASAAGDSLFADYKPNYAFLFPEGAQHMPPPEMPIGNGQIPSAENLQPTLVDKLQENAATVPQQSTIPSGGQDIKLDDLPVFRKIEVPNNKVGVLIGKAGETIRFLQFNSGAKIQITRDVDSDPHSSSRPVELTGTIENINKAEQLIKDVIAEADAGGSPSLVARGFGASQHGAEQLQIQVPNEKVGMIIDKGGETIKSLQARSGARIQLIPQHLPEGDISKERTVRITGNKEQIEAATEWIKEVMSQVLDKINNPHCLYRMMILHAISLLAPVMGSELTIAQLGGVDGDGVQDVDEGDKLIVVIQDSTERALRRPFDRVYI